MAPVLRSLRRPKFWIAAGVAFALAALYPLSLALQCTAADAQRWIQNDIAFTVFLLWLFPLVVGLVTTSVLPGVRRLLAPKSRRIVDGLSIILVMAALTVGVVDVWRADDDAKPIAAEPALLRIPEAMTFDATARGPLRMRYAALLEQRFLNEEAENQAWIDWEAERARVANEYRQKYPGFSGLSDALGRASMTAYVKFALNLFVAVVLALLFAALVGAIVLLHRAPTTKLNTEALLVACSLACLWFPMRLYSEWYNGYYSLERLRTYPAFWVLVLVALLSLALLIYILKPGRVALTIPSMAAAFGIVFTAVGALEPSVLWYLGAVVETFDVLLLFVIAVILVAPFAAVAVAATARDDVSG